jgi:hypothetical protein
MTTTVNINIEDLIEKIINNPPHPPKYHNLVFEDFNGVKNLFEFCMEVFTKLSVAKFGNAAGKVDVSTWTDKTIQLVGEYFASFGFKFNIIITAPNDANMSIYNSMCHDVIRYKPDTHLRSIVYMLKQPARVYIISFDYL